jgi:AcrR family transcriptional regulator
VTRRRYTKRVRAAQEAETRARIVAAALLLFAETGPLGTTITAVAARAGVQRLTVYRHFADESALFLAAWARLVEQHPWPDPAEWATIDDAEKRMRRALRRLYAYYEEIGVTLAPLLRDSGRLPVLREALRSLTAYQEGVIATLEPGWTPKKGKDAPLLAAALRHAVQFETWRSLAGAGLEVRAAARLMERVISGSARAS